MNSFLDNLSVYDPNGIAAIMWVPAFFVCSRSLDLIDWCSDRLITGAEARNLIYARGVGPTAVSPVGANGQFVCRL